MNGLIAERDLDIMIFGLSEKCPYNNDNPKDCQLHDMRKLSAKNRELLVQKLNFQEKIKIFKRHKECLKKKEYFSKSL